VFKTCLAPSNIWRDTLRHARGVSFEVFNYSRYWYVSTNLIDECHTPCHMQHYLWNLKLLSKVVSFLKCVTCFGLYGHHQLLQLLWVGNCCTSFRHYFSCGLIYALVHPRWLAIVLVCCLCVVIKTRECQTSWTFNEWVQQSSVRNNVSACFIKHVYHNMFRLKSKPLSGVIVYRILNASYH
jgi:hypothetical protein